MKEIYKEICSFFYKKITLSFFFLFALCSFAFAESLPHTSWGIINGIPSEKANNIQARFYRVNAPESYISKNIEENGSKWIWRVFVEEQGLWEVGDSSISIIGYEENSGLDNHCGYYGVVSSKLDDDFSSQRYDDITLRPIPSPNVSLKGIREVLVTWSVPIEEQLTSNIIGYNIYRSLDPATGFKLVSADMITTNSFSDKTVESSITYYYSLGLVFSGGVTSDYYSENSKSIYVSDVVEEKEVSGFVTIAGDEQVSLTWVNPDNVDSVAIYRNPLFYPWNISQGTLVSSWEGGNIPSSYLDTGLENGQMYYYLLIATANNGSVVNKFTDNAITVTENVWSLAYQNPQIYPKESNWYWQLENAWKGWVKRNVHDYGTGLVHDPDPNSVYSGSVKSEGIAYGLLLSVLMDDQATFNMILEAANAIMTSANPNGNPNGFYAWVVSSDGTTIIDSTAATDADEDIALALIFADLLQREGYWSTPVTSYRDQAQALINRIYQYEVENGRYLKPGDSWGGSLVMNPSYFAPAWYRIFDQYEDIDHDWDTVIDQCYSTLKSNNIPYSKGLVPDWCDYQGNQVLGRSYDFSYDAIRTLWRIALDAIWNNNANAKEYVNNAAGFISAPSANLFKLTGELVDNPVHNELTIAMWAAAMMASDDDAKKDSFNKEMSLYDNFVNIENNREFGSYAGAGQFYYNQSLALFGVTMLSGSFPNVYSDLNAAPQMQIDNNSVPASLIPRQKIQILTEYCDMDGYSDLDQLYLCLVNTDTGSVLTLNLTEGITSGDISYDGETSYYVTSANYQYQQVGPTLNVVWNFILNNHWQNSNAVKIALKATDEHQNDSGYTYSNANIIYSVKVPGITIDTAENITTNSHVTIGGQVSTDAVSMGVKLNGDVIPADYYIGSPTWAVVADLQEGINTFSFTIVNDVENTANIDFVMTLDSVAPGFVFITSDGMTKNYIVTISGFVSSDAKQIDAIFNGQAIAVEYVLGATSWFLTATLQEESNTFNFTVVDYANNVTTKDFFIIYSSVLPGLIVDNTENITNNKTITLEGWVSTSVVELKITLNNQAVENIQYTAGSPTWSLTTTLTEGLNEFEFNVSDGHFAPGYFFNIILDTLVPGIEFLTLSNPTRNHIVTINGLISSDVKQINVLLNNQSIPINYVSGETTWFINTYLQEGQNTFNFTFVDEVGHEVSNEYFIRYVSALPGILIKDNSSITRNSVFNLEGLVSRNAVSLKVTHNNNALESVQYVAGDSTWSLITTLTEGLNEFEFEVSDGYFVSNYNWSITLDTVPPEISILTNQGLDFVTTNSEILIKGSVSAEASFVYFNGSTQDICYTAGDTEWLATVNLEVGRNELSFLAVDSVKNTSDPVSMIITFNVYVAPIFNANPEEGVTASIEVPVGAVDKEAELIVTLSSEVNTFNVEPVRDDVTSIPIVNVDFIKAIKIELVPTGNDSNFTGKITVNSYVDVSLDIDEPMDNTADIRVFYFDEEDNKWSQEGISILNVLPNHIDFRTTHLTYFTVAEIALVPDIVSPSIIKFVFEDQENLASGDYVTSKPVLYITATDNMGVYSYRLCVYSADQIIEDTGFQNLEVVTTNYLFQSTITNELSDGDDYWIQIIVADEVGNTATTRSVSFKVKDSSVFIFDKVICAPNPFDPDDSDYELSVSHIGYQLNQPALVKLYIHSISGDRIYKETQNGIIGYNEFKWDGKDEWGDTVANGGYFAYLVADNGSDQKTVLVKIAVLR